MPANLYRVNLTQDEREHLLGITRRGQSSGRKLKRALILCKADEGLTDQQVAEALLVGPSTVGRVRQRFVEGGLKRALEDLPRPGQRRKLDGKQEARLVAVACSAAPEGHARWTLRLLADQAVELELTDSISRETVRQVLKKTNSSPRSATGQAVAEEGVVHPRSERRLRSLHGGRVGPLLRTL